MNYPPYPLLMLLVVSCLGYSIAGPWKLDIDDSYKNIDANTSIIFDFKKQIVNGSINNVVTVYACSVIDFQYGVVDSAVGFYLGGIGVNRRECVRDQVNEIILRMEKVALTTTIANKLFFLSPSGKPLLKLTKFSAAQPPKSLPGVWQSIQMQEQPSSVIVKANNSQIQLCNGNAVIDYKILRTNAIDVRVRQAKGCQENLFLTLLYRSVYFRHFGEQLWFYDADVRLLMKWANLGVLPGDQPIFFQTSVVKIVDLSQLNTTTNTTQPTQPNDTKTASIPIINGTTASKKEGDSLGSGPINNGVNPTIPPSPPSLVPPPIPPAQIPPKPIQPPITAPTTPPIPPTAPANPPSIKMPPPPPPAPQNIPRAAVPQYILNIKKQDIFTKWYLINAPVSTMAVITSNRIMVYGDCGVWFALYNLKDPVNGKIEIFNNEPKNTTPSCLDKNNTIQSLISNLKYLTIRQSDKNQRILSFWGKQNKIIGEWSSSKQK